MKRGVRLLGKPIAATSAERVLERKGILLFGPKVPMDFIDNGCSVPVPPARFVTQWLHQKLKILFDGWWRWA